MSSSASIRRITRFAARLVLDRDRVLREQRQLGRLDREARRLDRLAHGAEALGRARDLEDVAVLRRRPRRPRRRRPGTARPRRRPRRGTSTTPRRSNCHATAPVVPSVPPCFENAWRTSAAVRLLVVGQRLDDHRDALGAVALVDDRLERCRRRRPRRRPSRSRARCCPSASSTTSPSRSRSASARLFAGSPPPSFAATMIARVSFEKSLPRFASAAPFLCLIDDHLLCPDKAPLPYEIEKQLVEPRVVGQLRMERGDEEAPLAREHRMAVDLGQHLDVRADLLDPRRADEDGAQRLALARERRGRSRTTRPAARTRSGARATSTRPRWSRSSTIIPAQVPKTGPAKRAHRLVEAVEAHQARERRRLAARDHEAVEAVELLGLAHLDDVGAEARAASPRARGSCPARPERRSGAAPSANGSRACEARPRCRSLRRTSRAAEQRRRPARARVVGDVGHRRLLAAACSRGGCRRSRVTVISQAAGFARCWSRSRCAAGGLDGRSFVARRGSPGSAAAPASRRSTRRSRSGR